MKIVAFHNLGCKVNAYELDVLQQNFVKNGYTVVPFSQKADIYIVNTCTVTAIADRKSRQMLHRAKALNPEAMVVALGCYVETGKESILSDGAIDLAIGNHEKNKALSIIEDEIRKREGKTDIKADAGHKNDGKIIATDIGSVCEYEEMTLSGKVGRIRADIKVEDGCNRFCSYCLIPYARGRVRSRSIEDTVKEISGLTKEGYSEFVLTGINLSCYSDDKDHDLLTLIRNIGDIDGVKRIRLSSLEPGVMTEDFIKGISGVPQICPHFHLSLQSGCDETLKRMNRRYTTKEYEESALLLKEYFDRPALTTDVIAGFPGESEEEFKKTCEFVSKIGFYEMHVFPYSVRKNTAAEKLPGKLTQAVKKERASILINITEKQREAYMAGLSGLEEELLIEKADSDKNGKFIYTGHLKRYVPVELVSSDEHKPGDIVKYTC